MAVENVWVSDTPRIPSELVYLLFDPSLLKIIEVVCVIIPGFSPVSENAIMLLLGVKHGW